MYNINSHINVNFLQKTTGRSRERSASIEKNLKSIIDFTDAREMI